MHRRLSNIVIHLRISSRLVVVVVVVVGRRTNKARRSLSGGGRIAVRRVSLVLIIQRLEKYD